MVNGMRVDVLELECRSLAQRLFLLSELRLEPVRHEEIERQLQWLPDLRQQFRQAYAEWCIMESTSPAVDWATQALAI